MTEGLAIVLVVIGAVIGVILHKLINRKKK